MLVHSDPNNMNSIVYHLIIVRYSMKTSHWYFPRVTASHLYNMTGKGEKLQQLHCYHRFSDSLDIYLTKNHYENYSPKMVPMAKIWGSGSWTKCRPGDILNRKECWDINIQETCFAANTQSCNMPFMGRDFHYHPNIWEKLRSYNCCHTAPIV